MRRARFSFGCFGAWFGLACTPAAPPAAPAEPQPAEHAHGEHAHGEHAHGEHAHGEGFHKDFSDAEGFSAHFDDPARDAWQHPEEVLDLMAITPGSVVVDLGAGTGYFTAGLSRRVGERGRVLALDVEPKMVQFLEKRASHAGLTNVEARVVLAADPGLAPSSVSRVLIVNTWHHIDERSAYASKLADALAPGGQVWIVDFTLDSDQGPPAKHRLAPEQVISELEQGGLHAQVVEPEALPKQYVIRASR